LQKEIAVRVEEERKKWQDQFQHVETVATDRGKELERLRVQYEALRMQVGLQYTGVSVCSPID
jgi:hypothetical protein